MSITFGCVAIVIEDDFSKSVMITVLASLTTFVFAVVLFAVKSWWTNKEQKQRSRQNLAKAIHSELSALMEIYKQMELSETPPKSGEDLTIAHLTQNYISVYENNLDKIGILDKDDIEVIIKLYIGIKGLIDSHIYLAKRWEMYAQYTREPNKIRQEEDLKKEDVNSAHRAVFRYQEKIYDLFPDVLGRLEKYDK